MDRDILRDDQWERVKELLPGKAGDCGVTCKDNRLFLNAVLWIIRAGVPWRDLPKEYGNWNSVYRRFSRWNQKGVWKQIFEAISADADQQQVMLDSTVVRAHQHAAGAKGGSKIRAWDVLAADFPRKFMPK